MLFFCFSEPLSAVKRVRRALGCQSRDASKGRFSRHMKITSISMLPPVDAFGRHVIESILRVQLHPDFVVYLLRRHIGKHGTTRSTPSSTTFEGPSDVDVRLGDYRGFSSRI